MALFICSFSLFVSPFFFPLPVDPFLLAFCVARPNKAFWLSVFFTCFSVLGACVGYFIGFFFWDQFQPFVYNHWLDPETVEGVFLKIRSQGFWALFFAALTPLPFKIFAFASGVVQLEGWSFLFGSFLGRSLRFVSIGVLFHFFGKDIRCFLEKYFDKIVLSLSALLLIFFAFWFLLHLIFSS